MTYNELISYIQQNFPDNLQKIIKEKNARDVTTEIVKYIQENGIEVNDSLQSSNKYTYSITKIRELISAFSGVSFGGAAKPNDSSDTSNPIWYIATEPGKYTDFGNIT